MTKSFNKVYIHAVWSTKHRRRILSQKFEARLHAFIIQQFESMGCTVQAINNVEDHMHVLFHLSRDVALSEVIKQVKGASSRLINTEHWTSNRFQWQVGYSAFSVNYNELQGIKQYIRRQKVHHATKSFRDVYEEIMFEMGS